MIGGHCKASDGLRVRRYVCDKRSFHAFVGRVSRGKILATNVTAADWSVMNKGTEILLKFPVVIEIKALQKVADTLFLTI